MDLRTRLLAVAPVGGRQFAAFRIAFGLYLALHFAHLVGWGGELFSADGVLADATLNPTYGILPNVLTRWDSPGAVTAFLSAMVALSALFALGIGRRVSALALWYGWACLFNRNVLISNPSIPYVGLLLLLTTLVPPTEPWRLAGWWEQREGRKAGEGGEAPFYVPAGVFLTAWALMAVGYSFSGVVKLASPSWLDGTAFWHVVNNPLARTGPIRDLMLSLPLWVFQLLTWKALVLEVLFLPLSLWTATRPLAWLALVGMHLGIITLVSFADLSAGMLMVHAFTFDPRWLTTARAVWDRVTAWRRRAGTSGFARPTTVRDAA